MSEKKITKREKFEMLKSIPEVNANPMLVEFINHELELLSKKNASEKKPTAVQLENEKIKNVIYTILSASENPMTITEIQKSSPALSELTNQKITSLVGQLVKADMVEKIEDKRKSYFKAI